MVNKVYGLLGISSKAGKLISGTDALIDAILKRQIKLVIVAEDASERTIKNFKDICYKNNIKFIIYGNILENSKAIGKQNRAVLGIKDVNLARAIDKVIHGGEGFGEN